MIQPSRSQTVSENTGLRKPAWCTHCHNQLDYMVIAPGLAIPYCSISNCPRVGLLTVIFDEPNTVEEIRHD